MVNRGYGIKRIQKEIDKCIVLCLNCHAKLHSKERDDLAQEAKEEAKSLELMDNKT